MTRYTVLIDGEAGGYGVVFPELPGCAAMGATLDEALVNATAAAGDWVEISGQAPTPRSIEALRIDPDVASAISAGATLASVPLVLATGAPVKANLSLDAGVLAAIDAEAHRRKLTRSAFIELMARHALPELAG